MSEDNKPVKVTVTDPDTGEVLGERVVENDYDLRRQPLPRQHPGPRQRHPRAHGEAGEPMSERLLAVDVEPRPGAAHHYFRLGADVLSWVSATQAPIIAAELDRLYAAAEANQAPGPDWKAKLREQVGSEVDDDAHPEPWNDALKWVRFLIDALPDPPSPDPDAPPVYVPPEGHVAPVRGEDVPDGWEGRRYESDPWWRAAWCRDGHPSTLFEVRRVPAPEPATEWVPLTKLVGRTIKGETKPVGRFLAAINDACRWTADGTRWHYFPGGTLDIDTAQVLVLAEGERS